MMAKGRRQVINSYFLLWIVMMACAKRGCCAWGVSWQWMAQGGGATWRRLLQAAMANPNDPVTHMTAPREHADLPDGGGSLPCVSMFALKSIATSCTPLTTTKPGIEAELCESMNHTIAVLAVYSPTRHVFTVRVVGKQVLMLPLSYCSVTEREQRMTGDRVSDCDAKEPVHTSVAYAVIYGLLPGQYELQVQLQYTQFSNGKNGIRLAPDRALINTRITHAARFTGYPTTPTVIPNQEPCAYCKQRRATWSVCDLRNNSWVEGSWMLKQPMVDALLRNTSVFTAMEDSHNPELIKYQPKGCHMRPVQMINFTSCLADQHVCFVGDSQVRYVADGFADALMPLSPRIAVGDTPHKNCRCSGKQVPKCDFFPTHWGGRTVVGPHAYNLSMCTHVFVNWGQWPLSFQVPSRWNAIQFSKSLQDWVGDVKAHQALYPHTKFYWVTINAIKSGPSFLPCSDFRYTPFVELFNQLASTIMNLYGIPQINLFDITRPLSELTHDNAHYHWYGAVGSHITEYIANVVCPAAQEQLNVPL